MNKKNNKIKINKEIMWNIVNSILAGALVLFGAFAAGGITWQTFIIAIGTSGVVAITQFRDYWTNEKPEYCPKLFMFVRL